MGSDARERQSPAETARAGIEAWNTGDLEAFLQTVDPDMLWVTSGVFPGLRPSYSGHAGMREFWAAFMEPWEMLQIQIDRLIEIDDQSVLLLVRFHARGRDGIEVERTITNHMVMRGDKLARFQGYAQWEQALDEFGIEDPREGAGTQA
jgi:ketosteroid isomerase-like protein